MPDRPSLFALAASELSQDAFLGWLLSWSSPRCAPPDCAPADEALHRAGRRFLEQLVVAVNWPPVPADAEVTVELQVDRIDLLVKVGADRALVIEDKVDAIEAHNDLVAYKQRAAARLKVPIDQVAGVYLKTGDQSDVSKATQAGFVHFDRSRLLEVLQAAVEDGVRNDILLDFHSHLRRREAATGAWRSRPIAHWEDDAHNVMWRGFFGAIQARLGAGNWRFVNNGGGGVFAYWWASRKVDGGWLYLQVDSRVRLSVRVWVGDGEDRGEVRRRWQQRVTDAAQSDVVVFARPPNPRSGQTAEVARFERPWVIATEDGTLDLDATVDTLHAAAEWLNRVAPPAV